MCRPPSMLPWHPKGSKLSIPLHLPRAHDVFSSPPVAWCANQQPSLSAGVYMSLCRWWAQHQNWILSNMQPGKSYLWKIFHSLFVSERPKSEAFQVASRRHMSFFKGTETKHSWAEEENSSYTWYLSYTFFNTFPHKSRKLTGLNVNIIQIKLFFCFYLSTRFINESFIGWLHKYRYWCNAEKVHKKLSTFVNVKLKETFYIKFKKKKKKENYQ